MQVPIKHKRSAVAGSVPGVGDLALGELAVNTYDGKLFIRKDDGTPAIVAVGGGASMELSASPAASYTLVAADKGNYISIETGGLVTVPGGVFAAGDEVLLFNNSAAEVELTMALTTAWLAGATADEDVLVLAPKGLAKVLFLSANSCVVSGDVRVVTALRFLIIGGGGSTGKGQNGYSGGAGGAGGFIDNSVPDVATSLFQVTVGGQNGNSVLTNYDWFSATALAGGGGNPYGPSQGLNGGSGGGRHYSGSGGVAQQPLQTGYSFGYGHNGARSAGGGAGSAASGYSPGNGRASDITGTSVYYASGGPTHLDSTYRDGYYGRGGRAALSGYGTSGIQGIVILRASRQATSFVGSPAVSQVGTDWVYQFTASGTIQF